MRITCSIAFSAAIAAAAVRLHADPLQVFGGPVYVAPPGSGYTASGSVFGGNGVAVGVNQFFQSGTSLGSRPVRFDTTGDPLELGTLGGAFGLRAVNTTGTAIGYANRVSNGQDLGDRAVRWDVGAVNPVELEGLGLSPTGTTSSRTNAINTAGTVVGYAFKYVNGVNQSYRPVRWDAGTTTPIELQALGGESSASSISENGYIAGGGYGAAGGGTRALRWAPGSTVPQSLNLLDTTGIPTAKYSSARGINNAGTAVGFAYKNDSTDPGNPSYHAVRWDAGTSAVTELGTLGQAANGGSYSLADGINNAGTAYGISVKYVNGQSLGNRGVIWKAGQTAAIEMENLGTTAAGYTNTGIAGSNAAGLFVGVAYAYPSGPNQPVSHAVLWDSDGHITDLNTLIAPTNNWFLRSAQSITDSNWVSGIADYDPDGAGPKASYSRTFLVQVPEPGGMAVVCLMAAGCIRRQRRR